MLLFRRVIGTDPKTGTVPAAIVQKVQEREKYIAELEQMRQRMVMDQFNRRSSPIPEQFFGGA